MESQLEIALMNNSKFSGSKLQSKSKFLSHLDDAILKRELHLDYKLNHVDNRKTLILKWN